MYDGSRCQEKNGVAGTWRWCLLRYNAAPARQRVVAGGTTGGGSGGGGITREVQHVAADGDADAMCFSLVDPDAGNNSRVGDCASNRYG